MSVCAEYNIWKLVYIFKALAEKHKPVDFVTFRVDFVYTKEDGKWKIEYVLWYEGNKKPRLAQRKSKNQSKI